jgi:hypothetical protein
MAEDTLYNRLDVRATAAPNEILDRHREYDRLLGTSTGTQSSTRSKQSPRGRIAHMTCLKCNEQFTSSDEVRTATCPHCSARYVKCRSCPAVIRKRTFGDRLFICPTCHRFNRC